MKTELDTTKPSRVFDAWIASRLGIRGFIPKFTLHISVAFQLVHKMHDRGYWAQMRSPFGTGENNDGWWCGFTPHQSTGWNGRPDHWTSAPTLPLAICQAAYKTLTEQEATDATR